MSTFDRIAGLALEIDRYELQRLDSPVTAGWVRSTTVIAIAGGGEEGLGEDVTYAAEDHDALGAAGPVQPLSGNWTIETFSEHLGTLDLFPVAPGSEVYRNYRRWAFESAALDLALRQAGRPLHEALGRPPRPVNFVASVRLPEPPTLAPVDARLAQHPDLRFKLDPTASWDAPVTPGAYGAG